MDAATKKAFEVEFSSKDIPTHEDLIEFITDQVKALEQTPCVVFYLI